VLRLATRPPALPGSPLQAARRGGESMRAADGARRNYRTRSPRADGRFSPARSAVGVCGQGSVRIIAAESSQTAAEQSSGSFSPPARARGGRSSVRCAALGAAVILARDTWARITAASEPARRSGGRPGCADDEVRTGRDDRETSATMGR